MKKLCVKLLMLTFLCTAILSVGCFRQSSSSPGVAQSTPLANVSFVLNGSASSISSLRAATIPEVVFELRLLDSSSTANQVIRLRKTATVTASGTEFVAATQFTNVPALPCLAKMQITGGSILSATDSKNYSNWVGYKNLVAASDNPVVLYGEGSKTAVDVTVNLLDQLIVTPENVATMPVPLLDKAAAVVAGLDLTDSNVYANALTAYNQAYPTISSPADAEFALPTGYTSVAYPKSDATTNLTISSFNDTSEVFLVLVNRSGGNLTPSWSATKTSGSLRAARVAPKASLPASPATGEQKFHLWLRQQAANLPHAQKTGPALRSNLRAVALNDQITFQAYLTGSVLTNVPATCKRVVSIAGTSKNVCFFVDNNDLGQANLTQVLDGIAAAWANIYTTNRSVFGAEPEGALNTINVNDFYIFLSSRLYTAGYFYSGDMYLKSQVSGGYSNEKKMFYLQYPIDSSDLNRDISDLAATMAHEFQHMIHFYQKLNLDNSASWLDEAMSGYAEYVNNFRIETGTNQSKALQANEYLKRVATTKINGWHLTNDTNENISAHYGQAYLFGTWLAQNYGNSGSVQNLLSVQLVEEAAVEAFTAEPFNKTAAKFLMALLVNDTKGGVYGIKGLDLTANYSFGSGWSDVQLTGPNMTVVDFTAGNSDSQSVSSFAAAYVKITGGTGGNLSVTAILPAGVSLFQLKKN
jgi:hypothetical protein